MENNEVKKEKSVVVIKKHGLRADRIRNLKCYDRVVIMIKEGQSPEDVAEFIQDEGECCDIKLSTLTTHVRHLREDMPKIELISRRMPLKFAEVWKAVEKVIYELGELKDLYKLQRGRVDNFAEREGELPIPLPGLGDEIEKAVKILSTLIDKKMDLGVVERKLGRVSVNQMNDDSIKVVEEAQVKYREPSIAKMLTNETSRDKVLKIFDKITRVARVEVGKEEKAE